MLSVGWLVFAVLVAVLLTTWVTFTATRLDRLHARVDAAQAALEAQLVRRAAALLHVAESPDSGASADSRGRLDAVARAALTPDRDEPTRQANENAVGREIRGLAAVTPPLRADASGELHEAAARVLIARRFYNDAVRDTRALRARRMPRMLRMAGRRAMPDFFDIDDTITADREDRP
ncbi:hypothetical protein [uncultured Jatrophihabitans sp.]|uniref:hypothetical protein n=1 Tax=uncultured Jatrophihabitans sp. TaxID=1610747 RepID=UPI0035CBFE75